tara:strand:- start:4544 stop:6091 length:1548 start_codon:yes stop_codon:yes gene_type:complete
LYYNYLSSPDTLMRANLGAVGGMLTHSFEKAMLGLATGDAKHLEDAGKLMKGVWKSKNTWWDTLRGDPTTVHNQRKRILGNEYRFEVGEKFRDVGLGKWYTAGDLAAVEALRDVGMSTKEALRLTLTGTPESKLGQGIVGLQSRMLREGGYGQRLLAGTAMPFARVGVVGIEQGLKRTPLIGGIGWSKMAPDERMLSMIRQTEGAGAIGLGMASEEYLDPRLSQTIGTITGPAFLPFSMGRGMQRASLRTPPGALKQGAGLAKGAAQGALEFSPLGYSPMGFFTNTENELSRRFIPAGVSDVAEAMDPAFGRVSGRGELESRAQQGLTPEYQSMPGVGTAMSRVPILREKLPVQYQPVGPEGRPRFDSREPLGELGAVGRGLQRVIFPTRQQSIPPVTNLRDPNERFLYEMGINRQAPSPRGTFAGMRFDPTEAGASQMQLMRGLGPQIGRQMLTAGPMKAQLEALNRRNPFLARLLAQQMYQSITSGVGRGTGAAANILGLQGSGQPFGGFGGR